MHLRRILRLAAITKPRTCGDDQLVDLFYLVFFSLVFHAMNGPVKRNAPLSTQIFVNHAIFSNSMNADNHLRRSSPLPAGTTSSYLCPRCSTFQTTHSPPRFKRFKRHLHCRSLCSQTRFSCYSRVAPLHATCVCRHHSVRWQCLHANMSKTT